MSWFVLTGLRRLQCWISLLEPGWSRWVAWLDVVAAALRCPLMDMSASIVFNWYSATVLYSYILLFLVLVVLSPESFYLIALFLFGDVCVCVAFFR